MAKRILKIVETAYRATLEEQDDPVVWLAHALKTAGADVHLLLRGNAVNYAVRGQDASGLEFGGRRQTQPPRLAEDLASLVGKGAQVFYIEEDVAARNLERAELIDGVKPISQGGLPKLLSDYDQVWHW
jgi:predicted peroxiredoxin